MWEGIIITRYESTANEIKETKPKKLKEDENQQETYLSRNEQSSS